VVAFPSGKKGYVCQYRLTPSQTRSEARKLLGSVETGADPTQARRQARSVRTFGEWRVTFCPSTLMLSASHAPRPNIGVSWKKQSSYLRSATNEST
jgi:hypothetical protein